MYNLSPSLAAFRAARTLASLCCVIFLASPCCVILDPVFSESASASGGSNLHVSAVREFEL